MPPKKLTAAQQSYVYLVEVKNRDNSEFGPVAATMASIRAFADVEAANHAALTSFDDLMPSHGYECRNVSGNDFDGKTFFFHHDGSEDLGGHAHVTRTLLQGGTVNPLPTTKAGKPASKPKKTDSPVINDESDAADGVEAQVTPPPVTKSTTRAGSKRKTTDDTNGHDEKDETNQQSAPSGEGGCLRDYKFLVTGTLDPWTRVQADALIEVYGGEILKSMKPELDHLVVGAKPGAAKLAELQKSKFAHVEKISQEELYQLIEDSAGDGVKMSSEEVVSILSAAKGPGTKKKSKKS
ncbi:hypothetical protein AAFC00_000241 [Neodothiora populina]|uniref:BRCT domain-containing protein n=1 Tax=Neodothiora populina TaxID=2781224 RepID=A0ABR3P269_9PEZI